MKQIIVAAAAACLSMSCASAVQAQSDVSKKRGLSVGSARTVSPQAVGDSYKVLYRVAGTLERPRSSNLPSTAFMCSNYSANSEKIYFLTRDWNGVVKGSIEYTAYPNYTVAALTKAASFVEADVIIVPSGSDIIGGTTVIMSTTTNMHCSAYLFDRSVPTLNGVALHMVRFNALGGAME